jgi:hypothetical protein
MINELGCIPAGFDWKGAAAAVTLCAGVWLVGSPPISKSLILQGFVSKKIEV